MGMPYSRIKYIKTEVIEQNITELTCEVIRDNIIYCPNLVATLGADGNEKKKIEMNVTYFGKTIFAM